MFFQSFLRSSRLEVLSSKWLTAGLYSIFGLLVLAWWTFDSFQFVTAYRTLHAFDVSVMDFFVIDILLFTPLLLVGCFLLRSVLQRLRLQRWFKNQTNIPLYLSSHSPAAAGYLVDYEFGLEEAHATIVDLYFRGNITISEQPRGFALTLNDTHGTTDYESIFLKRLFAQANTEYIITLADPLLVNATQESHDHLLGQLQAEGFLPLTRRQDKKFRPLARLIYWIAGMVAALSVYAFVFDWHTVSVIGYPRYEVTASQLWLTGLISVMGIGMLLSGFLPRFTTNNKSTLSAGWLEAAGFKYYLQTVFKDRLSVHKLYTQDSATIRQYVPYMIAFRLVRLDAGYLRALLQHQEEVPDKRL